MTHNEQDAVNHGQEQSASGCDTCGTGSCSAKQARPDESAAEFQDRRRLKERLCHIKRKVLVLSGKGGVGKSTIAANLAVFLGQEGFRVGLLDADIHGPSIPTMLGLEGSRLMSSENAILPAEVSGIKVVSLGFFLQTDDDAVIWRGPMKANVIRQLVRDVEWGDLDFLVVDLPPGTGDEPLSVVQTLEKTDGAVIVTTPQRVASVDVRKCVTFCRQVGVPVIGVVENMSGFVCPKCGEETPIFRKNGGLEMSVDMDLSFLGSIPIDPRIGEACDAGRIFVMEERDTPTGRALREALKPVGDMLPRSEAVPDTSSPKQENSEEKHMRIAIPVSDGKLTMHFGHCDTFALIDADTGSGKILKREDVAAPPHEPGLLPGWLKEKGAEVIIAGGMGRRAMDLFKDQDVNVIVGAPAETPEELVRRFMAGTLTSGNNVCDH